MKLGDEEGSFSSRNPMPWYVRYAIAFTLGLALGHLYDAWRQPFLTCVTYPVGDSQSHPRK